MWKIVSRVQLKDQHMIDTRLPPAIRVNPQQEEKLNQQETATVDAYQWPDVLIRMKKAPAREGSVKQLDYHKAVYITALLYRKCGIYQQKYIMKCVQQDAYGLSVKQG